MSLSFQDLKTLNKIVYSQLNEILKTLDKKLNLKLYSIILDNNDNCKEITRIKKTLSTINNETEISQDNLNHLNNLFNELGIDNIFEESKIRTEFVDYCNQQKFINLRNNQNTIINETQNNEILITEEVNSRTPYIHEDNSRILYVNNFNVRITKMTYTVNYILEIRNADLEIIESFYNQPVFSFLRMALDYYFIDYFVETQNRALKLVKKGTVTKKYNEDSIQFTRRITRLYFGKLQEILLEKGNLKEIPKNFPNKLNNQYYISDLFEKIDDISNHTYENSNPFGSILFLNSKVLKSQINPIDFTIKFKSDDLIALNDSKLIRKLLELTSEENDLFLISDHEKIHGLGKINWNQFDDSILFRIDFRGLSKYSMNLITTKESETSEGNLIFESGKKIYKTSRKLEIINNLLLKISFKSPLFSGEGYTGEKFKRLLNSEYFDDDFKISDDAIEYLENVVMYAREQKHGTMVVITDYETAVSELKTLKKQSISIESVEIVPEYIKFLTSIDGVIYFDTNGKCHAIGVILDGFAKENIGDASRGARYNSAYRYLEKLKELNKKCIIVIISEDGMVNLIPEPENEEKIYALFQQLIDLLKEDNEKEQFEINKIEEILMNKKNIDYHLFFKVAEIYRSKDNYKKAIEYYEKGLEVVGRNTIFIENYRNLANLYFLYARNPDISLPKKYQKDYYEKAKKYFDKYVIKVNDEELTLHDYNNKAITYDALGDLEKLNNNKQKFYQKALNNFSKAIEKSSSNSTLLSNNSILLSNRAYTLKSMGMLEKSLEDLIEAELISLEGKYVNKIINLIDGKKELIDHCIHSIINKNDDKRKSDDLIKELGEINNTFKERYIEISTPLV